MHLYFLLDFNTVKIDRVSYYIDIDNKNEWDLFKNLLNMPMLLCKGFTSHQQLLSCIDWASV